MTCEAPYFVIKSLPTDLTVWKNSGQYSYIGQYINQ